MVILVWVKPADDGSKNIIVRLYEPVGESTTADILADYLIAEATVCETDLLEVAGATHDTPSALEGAWIPLQSAHLNLRPPINDVTDSTMMGSAPRPWTMRTVPGRLCIQTISKRK